VVEIYECRDPQRRLQEFMSAPTQFGEAVGSRSPNYRRGQRFCPQLYDSVLH